MTTDDLLPEDLVERDQFNRDAETRGSALLHMAGCLSLWGKMEMAKNGGSYGRQLVIMANECAKAHAALEALSGDMVVVPREPTEAMRIAALNTQLPGIGEPPLYEKIWQSMIAAVLKTTPTPAKGDSP